MAILRLQSKRDLLKLHECAETQLEHDLIETLEAWRTMFIAPLVLIESTAQACLLQAQYDDKMLYFDTKDGSLKREK